MCIIVQNRTWCSKWRSYNSSSLFRSLITWLSISRGIFSPKNSEKTHIIQYRVIYNRICAWSGSCRIWLFLVENNFKPNQSTNDLRVNLYHYFHWDILRYCWLTWLHSRFIFWGLFLASGYCRCLRLCVCVSVRLSDRPSPCLSVR